MGNREDLLAGAKRCLIEKGYARTTARDIATAAGTSLAAIGYHYGSTEALLNAALYDAIGDWGAELERAMSAELAPDAAPLERFEEYWTRVIDSFASHRTLWASSLEAFAQIDRVPELRRLLADGIQQGRNAWAALLLGIDPESSPDIAQAVGSFHQALLSGVMVQWLVDPDRAPSPEALSQALQTITAAISPRPEAAPPGGRVGEEAKQVGQPPDGTLPP